MSTKPTKTKTVTRAQLIRAIQDVAKWEEHMGGWDAPVWKEVRKLARLTEPDAPPPVLPVEVIVEVLGGNVQAAYSSDPTVKLSVIDWDNAKVDPEAKAHAEALDDRTDDMHTIPY